MRYVVLNTLALVTAFLVSFAVANAQDAETNLSVLAGTPTLAEPAQAEINSFAPAQNSQFTGRHVVVTRNYGNSCGCNNCACSTSVTRSRGRCVGNACAPVRSFFRSRTVVRERGCSTCN